MRERLSVVVADITTLDVDVIVNAANEQLSRGSGVCGAIFRAAGPQLDAACATEAPCPTGEARITPGFDARARWIIHAVGPVWHGGNGGEPELLAGAYRASLKLARDCAAGSIAFPAISTGIYGYPRDDAAKIAIQTVRAWCAENGMPGSIVFCCFSDEDALSYSSALVA